MNKSRKKIKKEKNSNTFLIKGVLSNRFNYGEKFMKKKFLLLIIPIVLILNGCTLGGFIEAEQLEGTWVSESAYHINSNSYYIYYDFYSTSIDLHGNLTGSYRIRRYNDIYWWNNNYVPLEEGRFVTDYFWGRITLTSLSGQGRTLDYTISDYSLIFTDNDYWSNTRIVLTKY